MRIRLTAMLTLMPMRDSPSSDILSLPLSTGSVVRTPAAFVCTVLMLWYAVSTLPHKVTVFAALSNVPNECHGCPHKHAANMCSIVDARRKETKGKVDS